MKLATNILTIIFILLVLYSCKKDASVDKLGDNTTQTNQLEQKIKAYLENEMKKTSVSRGKNLKGLEENIDFKSLSIRNYTKDTKIILADINTVLYKINGNPANNKIVFYFKGNEIIDASIIAFSSKDPLPEKLEEIIALKKSTYTGSMSFFTLYNKYSYTI